MRNARDTRTYNLVLLASALLVLAGTIIGLFGDYPFDSLPHLSIGLTALGGTMAGLGIALLILMSGGRGGGRGDEPPGHINP